MTNKYSLSFVMLFILLYTRISFCADHETPPVPVEAVTIMQQPVTHGVVSTGELRANQSIVLKAEVSGKIARINLPEGKSVAAGTLLIELENAVSSATLDKVQAKLKNSKMNYERLQTLSKKGIASESDRDAAFATMRFDQASVEQAKAELEKTKIRAPFSGILGFRQVDVGDYIDPGQALINLDDIGSLIVDFKVPEKHINQLKIGLPIEISIEAFPNQVFTGTIYAIAPQLDTMTRTLQARASLPNLSGVLRPGLFAKLRVILEKKPSGLVLPEQAVFMQQGKSFVYLINNNNNINQATLTEVTTGTHENGQIEILSGLKPNSILVKSGHMKLYNGATVAIISQSKSH